MFLQQFINGVTLGGIYALIALGYTLVYGILLLINFAHSEIFMMGAYFGLFILIALSKVPAIASSPAMMIFASMFFAMVLTGILGMTIEFSAYRPLRKASRLAPLISAIGVSIFLQNLMMLIASAESKPFYEVFPIRSYNITSNASISPLQIFIIITSLALMFILNIFITRTKMGKAMRATSQDMETARIMGIDVNLVISMTFFIGAALGGAAGVLNGMYYGSIKYNMGFIPGVKAFTAAVLGGIGNVKGAMLGGFMLGILECFGAGYISSEYKDVFAFVILIIVLIFRPQGLLGQRATDKV